VVPRKVAYTARWNQLGVEGQSLVIDAADPTFPSRYVKRAGGEGEAPTLEPVRDRRPKIPASSILYITTGSKFTVPPDAMVLLMDRKPGDKWPYLVLYLVLVVFVVANIAALALRLRDRTGRKQQ
jgi:hypothetical protein